MGHETTGTGDVRRNVDTTRPAVADQAQRTADVKLSSQKDQVASTLHTLAQTIREGGDRMGEDQPQVASLAGQAATKVDEASSYLRQHDLGDFMHEAEDFARREPLIFLGGAFASGFLAMRFLKAASPQRTTRSSDAGSRRSSYMGGRDWSAVGPGRTTATGQFAEDRRPAPAGGGSPSAFGRSEA
jgi:hypothetical protein